MKTYENFKRNLILKAVFIPLAVTILATGIAYLAAPIVQDILPDTSSYTEQIISEEQIYE